MDKINYMKNNHLKKNNELQIELTNVWPKALNLEGE